MRRRVATTRETLQAELLPPTEYMELNYRPELSPAFSTAWGAFVIGGSSLAAVAVLFWLLQALGPYAGYAFNFTALLAVTFAVLLALNSDPIRPWLTWPGLWRQGGLTLALVAIVTAAVFTAPGHPSVFAFLPALGVTLAASYVCAKQFAYWMTVNPAVDWPEMRLWQALWTKLPTTALPPECPELLTARVAVVALVAQTWLGYEVLHWLARAGSRPDLQMSAGLIALAAIVVPLPCYWWVWHRIGVVPRISWWTTWHATFASLHVWFGYVPLAAPGVFMLPDRWLRSLWVRHGVAVLTLASLTTGMLLLQISPQRTAPVAVVLTAAQLIFGPHVSSASFDAVAAYRRDRPVGHDSARLVSPYLLVRVRKSVGPFLVGAGSAGRHGPIDHEVALGDLD